MKLHTSIVAREYDKSERKITRILGHRFASSYIVHEEKYLHAKLIVTKQIVLQMSANLIPTTLYRNVETCVLSRNSVGDVRRYIRHELKLAL